MNTSRQQLERELIDLLAQVLETEASRFERDATLSELGITSLSTVEAVFAIEEKYDISIPFNANDQKAGQAGAFSSVGSLLDMVIGLVEQRRPAPMAAPAMAAASAGD